MDKTIDFENVWLAPVPLRKIKARIKGNKLITCWTWDTGGHNSYLHLKLESVNLRNNSFNLSKIINGNIVAFDQ